jgi:hypothetical protein
MTGSARFLGRTAVDRPGTRVGTYAGRWTYPRDFRLVRTGTAAGRKMVMLEWCDFP